MRTVQNLLILSKVLILSLTAAHGQMTQIHFDYLIVDEAPIQKIGFLGTGVSLFHPNQPVFAGIRINNAFAGVRGGYYTYGYHVGAQIPISKAFTFTPQAMFTAGGGAESNDGSGGFGTLSASVEYHKGRHGFGLGAQYSYVSTGVIQGASPYFKYTIDQSFEAPLGRPAEAQIFTNTMLSSINEPGRSMGFIGVGGRTFQGATYFSAHLNAAVTDLGGYMEVYGGYGWRARAGSFSLLAEANFGTGGGGRAPAGGGAMWGGQVEIQYGKELFVGGTLGYLSSLGEPFYYQFAALRLGTNFSFQSPSFSGPNASLGHFSIENAVRTYVGEDGFSNIGTAFQLYTWGIVSLRGETYWAFTDGRGAYAEGLFGLRGTYNGWYIESQLGAGAGGGINLWGGAGLAFVNAGYDLQVSKNALIGFKGIRNVFSTTPFPAWGYQIGFTYRLPFKILEK